MTKNVLLPCQVSLGDRLLFPKTRLNLLSMEKWLDWVLGHLLPYITAKNALGEIMKCFESSVPVIEMAKIVLLPCHVTYAVPPEHSLSENATYSSFHGKDGKTGF